MDNIEKQEVVETSIENLDTILSELESIRECKRIYDMLDRARGKLDELSETFDSEEID